MGNLTASENVKNDFKKIVFKKHGKLYGVLREEVDEALRQHSNHLRKKIKKMDPTGDVC